MFSLAISGTTCTPSAQPTGLCGTPVIWALPHRLMPSTPEEVFWFPCAAALQRAQSIQALWGAPRSDYCCKARSPFSFPAQINIPFLKQWLKCHLTGEKHRQGRLLCICSHLWASGVTPYVFSDNQKPHNRNGHAALGTHLKKAKPQLLGRGNPQWSHGGSSKRPCRP